MHMEMDMELGVDLLLSCPFSTVFCFIERA